MNRTAKPPTTRPRRRGRPRWMAHWAALALFSALAAAPAPALTDEDIASIGMAAARPAVEPDATQPPGMAELAGKVVLAMGAVMGLMAAAAWAARRWLPQSAAGGLKRPGIEILASRPIGSRRNLLLVRVQGRTVLLGATPHSIQPLSEFDPPAATQWEATQPAPEDFAAELRRGTTMLEKG